MRESSLDNEFTTCDLHPQILATLSQDINHSCRPDFTCCAALSTQGPCNLGSSFLDLFPLLTVKLAFFMFYSACLHCHPHLGVPHWSLRKQHDGLHCQYNDSAV